MVDVERQTPDASRSPVQLEGPPADDQLEEAAQTADFSRPVP